MLQYNLNRIYLVSVGIEEQKGIHMTLSSSRLASHRPQMFPFKENTLSDNAGVAGYSVMLFSRMPYY